MHRLILLGLIFVTMNIYAQEPMSFSTVDSTTYQCYLSNDWEKLIKTANEAINQGIDYKYLRQRLGYAYFVKSDFYASQKQYEKALAFDKTDNITHLYLYYCGVNTGNRILSGYHASKLSAETKKALRLKPFKIINSVDVEYNYKTNDDSLEIRSNSTYYRFGVNTQLGYKAMFYQTVSKYTQTVNNNLPITQIEYYGLLSLTLSSHSLLSLAYHRVNTKADTLFIPGNLYYAKLTKTLNRFYFGLNGSVLNTSLGNNTQIGISGGVTIPGNANLYLNGSLQSLRDSTSNQIIFSQSVGANIFKPLWIEGNITVGNMKNYNSNNGLYLYNSQDATTFRTGVSLFYYLGKNIILTGNYTYDRKEIADIYQNIFTKYNQHSFSGGIIWKI